MPPIFLPSRFRLQFDRDNFSRLSAVAPRRLGADRAHIVLRTTLTPGITGVWPCRRGSFPSDCCCLACLFLTLSATCTKAFRAHSNASNGPEHSFFRRFYESSGSSRSPGALLCPRSLAQTLRRPPFKRRVVVKVASELRWACAEPLSAERNVPRPLACPLQIARKASL